MYLSVPEGMVLRTCMNCSAVVPAAREAEHDRWHEALTRDLGYDVVGNVHIRRP